MTHASDQSRLPDWLVLNRNFVLLWFGYGVSAVGDHLSEMALLRELGGFARQDVTRVQALLTFGFFLPFVVLGPLAGWWADRFSRKWTMIAADVLRAIVVLNLSLLVPFLAVRGFGVASAVLPVALVGALAASFSPCRQAMLPTLIRDDQLVRANAMISALGTIGTILSAYVGGKLVDLADEGLFDLHWNYRLNAVTFLLSAIAVFFIAMRLARPTPHVELTGVWTPVIDGFRYVLGHRRVLQLIALGTAFWAAAGVVISVVPALVRDVFGGDYADAGLYRGLIGIGLATGAAVMTIFGPAIPLPMRVMSGLLGGVFWVLLLSTAYLWKMTGLVTLTKIFSGLCLFGVGSAGAALLVSIMAAIQRFVPDSRRGRVFGVSDMATMAAMVAATAALGLPNVPMLDRYVPYIVLFAGLGLVVVFALACRVYFRSEVRSPVVNLILWTTEFVAKFLWGMRRIGPCTVPRRGPVILAVNHTAGIDPMVLLVTCPHRLISYLVAKEFYYASRIARWFMDLVHCIPIDRTTPEKSALAAALRLLHHGGCLGVFPQGYIGRTGAPPLPPQQGVGLLALRSGATVIPCHIGGVRHSDSVAATYLMRHQVRVRYGRPVDLSAWRGREKDRDAAREVSELVMRKINELGRTTDNPNPERQ